jgi:Enoyl-(Acyl carrier protein) reductase
MRIDPDRPPDPESMRGRTALVTGGGGREPGGPGTVGWAIARLRNCWDAAAVVLFLASDQARWISGQVLPVDGGGPPRARYPGVKRETAGAGTRA